jgi:hypothetical protein
MADYTQVQVCFAHLLCSDVATSVASLSGYVELSADTNTAHRLDIANPVMYLANFRGDVTRPVGTNCLVTCPLPQNRLISGITKYVLHATSVAGGETKQFTWGFVIKPTAGSGPVDILTSTQIQLVP